MSGAGAPRSLFTGKQSDLTRRLFLLAFFWAIRGGSRSWTPGSGRTGTPSASVDTEPLAPLAISCGKIGHWALLMPRHHDISWVCANRLLRRSFDVCKR